MRLISSSSWEVSQEAQSGGGSETTIVASSPIVFLSTYMFWLRAQSHDHNICKIRIHVLYLIRVGKIHKTLDDNKEKSQLRALFRDRVCGLQTTESTDSNITWRTGSWTMVALPVKATKEGLNQESQNRKIRKIIWKCPCPVVYFIVNKQREP